MRFSFFKITVSVTSIHPHKAGKGSNMVFGRGNNPLNPPPCPIFKLLIFSSGSVPFLEIRIAIQASVNYGTKRNEIQFFKITISVTSIHPHKAGKGSQVTKLTSDLEVKVTFYHVFGPKSLIAFLSMKEWSQSFEALPPHTLPSLCQLFVPVVLALVSTFQLFQKPRYRSFLSNNHVHPF